MKLTKLSMANFRGFEHLELGFEKDINVIAGENGKGKSSILFALSRILSHVISDFTQGREAKLMLSDTDIRNNVNGASNWLHVSGKFDLAHVQIDFAIDRIRLGSDQINSIKENILNLELELLAVEGATKREIDKKILRIKRDIAAWEKVLREGNERTSLLIAGLEVPDVMVDSKSHDKSLRAFKKELKDRPNQPIAIYYTTKRFFNDPFKPIEKLVPFTVKSAYEAALEDLDVSLEAFAKWFYFVSKNKKGERIALRMTEVISDFIPEIRNLRFADDGSNQLQVDKSGVTLPLTNLSDGERGVLAMVFDLTRRLSLANPRSEDPIGTGEAIVLIDEIELHLHPNWQRQIVARLLKAFPKCQFIVTTHSPQILGELDASKIWILSESKPFNPLRSFGMDSSQILEEIMDVSPRNKQIGDKLRKLAIAVNKSDKASVSKIHKQLRKLLGESAPEVLEAETMLQFLGEE